MEHTTTTTPATPATTTTPATPATTATPATPATTATTSPTEDMIPITLRPSELLGCIIGYMIGKDADISVTVPKMATLKAVLRATCAALPDTNETVTIFHRSEAERYQNRKIALANVAAWKAEADEKAKMAAKLASDVAADNISSGQSSISYGRPIRTKYDIASLPMPKPLSKEARQRLMEGAKLLDDSRQPYALTLAAHITEGTLPVVKGKITLTAIDAKFENPKEEIQSIDMLWDTGAHQTIVSEELLSESFLRSLRDPIHDIYRSPSGLRLQMDGIITLSNAAVEIHGIVLVVPKTVVPNERVGVIFGQSQCINQMRYESVPRSILVKEGEKIDEEIWGDIIIRKMINEKDELVCL